MSLPFSFTCIYTQEEGKGGSLVGRGDNFAVAERREREAEDRWTRRGRANGRRFGQ